MINRCYYIEYFTLIIIELEKKQVPLHPKIKKQ